MLVVIKSTSVTAQTPADVTITDASDDGNDFDQNTVDDRTETIIPRTPGIEVTKTSTITDNNGDNTYGVGDTVVYTLTIANTGNLDFTSVVLDDVLSKKNGGTLALTVTPTFKSSTLGSDAGSLKVSETATYVASYTIAQEAIDGGGLSNQASVTAASLTATVTDLSDDGIDNDGNTTDDPTENILFGTLILEATKTATVTDVDGNGETGLKDIINYTIAIENKGRSTKFYGYRYFRGCKRKYLTLNATPTSSDPDLLAQAVKTYVTSYTIAQALDNGGVRNSALVRAVMLQELFC